MQELLQELVATQFGILWVVWFAGTVMVTLQALTKYWAYVRHFPLLQHNTALWQRQVDPELEQLRHQVWRRVGVVILWGLGTPLLVIFILQILESNSLLYIPQSCGLT